jgi:sugar (pentulose or hexulose) kinase
MKETIAIFDIGKTNKKVLLFDKDLNMVYQKEQKFPEIKDEDNFLCDDIHLIDQWIKNTLAELSANPEYNIKAVNFSTYGATLMFIDENGNPLTPLYNYLKPMPAAITDDLYAKHGGVAEFSRKTASPAMGFLNSGLQILWLKKTRPEVYEKVKHILHFPQYCSYILSKNTVSEHTSIGCHTAMWDFDEMRYHDWLADEGISLPDPVPNTKTYPVADATLNTGATNDHAPAGQSNHPGTAGANGPTSTPPTANNPESAGTDDPESSPSAGNNPETAGANNTKSATTTSSEQNSNFVTGTGIHDSSASLAPYIIASKEKFILLSTGTWCINMNPYNYDPLTDAELQNDCLSYMSVAQKPVKSSRLFMGHMHDVNLERINEFFGVDKDHFKSVKLNKQLAKRIMGQGLKFFSNGIPENYIDESVDYSQFATFEEAYHQLMMDLTTLNKLSIDMVIPKDDDIQCIYISGGFARNEIFVSHLATLYKDKKVYTSEIDNATALGAAMVVYSALGSKNEPTPDLGLQLWKPTILIQ